MTTVLTFHRVVDRLEQDHDVSWDTFRRLTDSLSATVVDLDGPLALHTVALTFDDATEDHVHAAEELRGRGLSATFFVPAAHLGTSGHLDEEQVSELVSMGHVVGSHALHHRPFAQISPEDLRYQVHESRVRLERICGRPVDLFAPPGGIGHRALVSTLKSEAYRACRRMRWGIYLDPGQRWDIPCVPVTEYTWRKGWVRHAIDRDALAFAMRLGGAMKQALPPGLASSIREGLHRRLRASGRRSPTS
jgi:peptidoglycan/xylan/chitin deacetylase (PgdA/CDA1 family)